MHCVMATSKETLLRMRKRRVFVAEIPTVTNTRACDWSGQLGSIKSFARRWTISGRFQRRATGELTSFICTAHLLTMLIRHFCAKVAR